MEIKTPNCTFVLGPYLRKHQRIILANLFDGVDRSAIAMQIANNQSPQMPVENIPKAIQRAIELLVDKIIIGEITHPGSDIEKLEQQGRIQDVDFNQLDAEINSLILGSRNDEVKKK